MNNIAFFEYLDSLIKEDKLAYTFRQIEHFLEEVEKIKRAEVVVALPQLRTTYTLLENRYNRWYENQFRMDSRDSRIEINQIVDGILSNLGSLKALQDIQYAGYQHIIEPVLAEPKVMELSKPKMKWYWWVVILLGIFSAAGVTYLLLKKEEPKKEEETPIEKKRALTLILHELGDRKSTTISNQGRLSIRDLGKNSIAKDIGNNGVVRFNDLENWVFEAESFLVLDLQGLDERVFKYKLLDSLYDRFIPNDTVFVPFIKEEIKQQTDSVVNNNINLVFYSAKSDTKKTFAFAKDATVARLKDHIISKFVDKDDLRYGMQTILTKNGGRLVLEDESKLISAAGIKEKDVLGLNIISVAKANVADTRTLNLKGQTFAKKPLVRLNNKPIETVKRGESYVVQVPNDISDEKYHISIQDGESFYSKVIEKTDKKEISVDVSQMRKANIKEALIESNKIQVTERMKKQ